MLSLFRRLIDRFRRRPAGATPAVAPAETAARASQSPVIRLTFRRRQVPVLLGLLLANLVLIVGATAYVSVTLIADAQVAASPTPVSPESVSTAIAVQLPTLEIVVTPPPAGPSATPPPNPLSLGGTVFFAYRHNGRTNLWAHSLGQPDPVRITAGPWDDRDPAVSPDGRYLAFSSRREGSWNLYLLDLGSGEVRRLTSGLEFKSNPTWSPDSQFLAFELYRQDNLDIAIIGVDGGDLIDLTTNRACARSCLWRCAAATRTCGCARWMTRSMPTRAG